MTYSSGNIIASSDFNSFRGPYNINQAYTTPSSAIDVATSLIGIGIGDRGYGQPTPLISSAVSWNEITHTEWNALQSAMSNINIHTGSNLNLQPVVFSGNVIIPENGIDVSATSNISINLESLDHNRLLFDNSQMITNAAISSTMTQSWSGNIVHEFTVDFGTEDSARFFFNSGGAIILSANLYGSSNNVSDAYIGGLLSSSGNVYVNAYDVSTDGDGFVIGGGYYTLTKLYSTVFANYVYSPDQNLPPDQIVSSTVYQTLNSIPYWSDFMNQYAVWIDQGDTPIQPGIWHTSHRTFTPDNTGYYTFTYQGGQSMKVWCDNSLVDIVNSTNAAPSSSTLYLSAQEHVIRFDCCTDPSKPITSWSDNPVGWACTVTDSNSNIVWDTRTYSLEETITYDPSTFVGEEPVSTQSFSYSSANTLQTFVVPPNVTKITAKLWGPGGAGGPNFNGITKVYDGGAGVFVQATIPVTPGETLIISIGGGGLAGQIGTSPLGEDCIGGGGGGFTAIYRGTEPLVIAGGGGGSPANNHRTDLDAGWGGNAGIIEGFHGVSCTGNVVATGGSQTQGGLGQNGIFGSWLKGASGGYTNPYDNGGINSGGPGGGTWGAAGGGAGYWGGGAGDAQDPNVSTSRSSCGGGGGSSYISQSSTNSIGCISRDRITAPMNLDPDCNENVGCGGQCGKKKGDNGYDGGGGAVVIYCINETAPDTPYSWTIQAKTDNYVGLNEANGSLLHFKSIISTGSSSVMVDGTTASNVSRRKASGVLTIAEPIFSTINALSNIPIPVPVQSPLLGPATTPVPTPNPLPAPVPVPTPTAIPIPTVLSITPTSGPTTGGAQTTISGNNFIGATTVNFGSTAATSFSVTNSTTITSVTPAGTVGTVNVSVTTSSGTGTGINLFTYVAPPLPSPACVPSNIYTAVYSYPQPGWTGTPVLTFDNLLPINITLNNRQEMLNYFGIPNDSSTITNSWCTRWLGYIEVPASGTWTFTLNHSHGLWLWLNGNIIINNDDVGNDSYDVALTAGKKYSWQLDMEHEENEGFEYPFYVTAYWKGPTVPKLTVIPSSAFCFDPNNPPPAKLPVDKVND